MLGALAFASTAEGRGHVRRFEPTDLDLEAPGTLQFDAQLGLVSGNPAWRALVPDFEIDLGVLSNVEIGVDSAVAFESPDLRGVFDRAAPDSLWLSVKLGILDIHDDATDTGWAFGAQLGPKVPLDTTLHGAGYEALLLVRRSLGDVDLVLNAGVLVDPGSAVARGRPFGVEGGLDARWDLPRTRLSVLAEVGGVVFVAGGEHLLHTTGGLSWAATDALDLSAVGIVGLLDGGERVGILLGASPKIHLW